jgi:C1A family cysteine protease
MFKVGGHRPDPLDQKFKNFDKAALAPHINPGDVDLRQFSSPRHNQRQTSTCVAQSTIKALEIKRIQKHGIENHVPLSVMDLYFGARDLMDPKETNIDNGTFIYLACEVLKRFGVCREEMNPFKESNIFIPTPILASREAYMNKIADSFKIYSYGNNRIDDVIANLQVGNPVVFATQVGDTWFQYNENSEPLGLEKNPKGGHAICLVGYVDGKFIIENSWGNDWGHDGFAYLQPEVLSSNDSMDFWSIADGSEVWYEK